MLRLLLGLLAVATLTGCPGGGSMLDSLSYPKTQPKPQDLVGLYVPDAATLQDILERGHYPKRDIAIRLSADGTVTCKNVPDWWSDGFGRPSGKFLNKTGTWKVLPREEWWEVGLDFDSPKHFVAASNTIALVGQKPPYTLRILLGDPDQGKGMDFTKRE